MEITTQFCQKHGAGGSTGPCACERFGFMALLRIATNGGFEGFHVFGPLSIKACPSVCNGVNA
jgi:hypothetical protein